MTKNDFINKASLVHHGYYDYKDVVYINNKTKVKIICPVHGAFLQRPNGHLNGKGCIKCAYAKRKSPKKTTKVFVKEAKQVHGNRYDYSEVNYIGSESKVKIKCKAHGAFYQTPMAHLQGQGCPMCAGRVKGNATFFIKKAHKIHGNKYRYDQVIYKDTATPVKIECPIHGNFYQRPGDHLRGRGCPSCASNHKLTTEEFVAKSNQIHNNMYSYKDTVYINTDSKVAITCPKHGVFFQTPHHHLYGHGCPVCSAPKNERIIHNYLQENGIIFKEQYKIIGCKNKRHLRFDFAIFNTDNTLKCLIEYQGKQHYKKVTWFGGYTGLKYRKENDKIKQDFCSKNNILLYYIKYTDDTLAKLQEIFYEG